MRLHRLQFTTRRMIVGVVVTAALLVLVKKMTRPYPTWSIGYGAVSSVMWSDGSTTLDGTDGPAGLRWQNHGLVTVVDWPAGAKSVHLHLPNWVAARLYPSPGREKS